MLLAPLRTWTAHVVQLGAIRVGRRTRQSPPMALTRGEAMRRRMTRQQNRADIGRDGCAHAGLLLLGLSNGSRASAGPEGRAAEADRAIGGRAASGHAPSRWRTPRREPRTQSSAPTRTPWLQGS